MSNKDIKAWMDETGLSAPENAGLTIAQVQEYAKMIQENDVDINMLLRMIMEMSAYSLYLKSEKGRLLAQQTIHEDIFRRRLYMATQKVEGERKTKDEREATALYTNKELRALADKVASVRARYNRIKEIPMAVDNLINNARFILTRKMNAEKGQD
jgi:hypothetical protein